MCLALYLLTKHSLPESKWVEDAPCLWGQQSQKPEEQGSFIGSPMANPSITSAAFKVVVEDGHPSVNGMSQKTISRNRSIDSH